MIVALFLQPSGGLLCWCLQDQAGGRCCSACEGRAGSPPRAGCHGPARASAVSSLSSGAIPIICGACRTLRAARIVGLVIGAILIPVGPGRAAARRAASPTVVGARVATVIFAVTHEIHSHAIHALRRALVRVVLLEGLPLLPGPSR